MRAPRVFANSSSSRTTQPPPSLNTKPSRSLSNGRDALSGALLRRDRACAWLNAAIGATRFLAVHVLEGIEVTHLAADRRLETGRVEARDRPDAAAARAYAVPGLRDRPAERRDHAEAGHDDATALSGRHRSSLGVGRVDDRDTVEARAGLMHVAVVGRTEDQRPTAPDDAPPIGALDDRGVLIDAQHP